MFIRSTHRLEFTKDGSVFVTAGGNIEQEAPDWIAEDDYFIANEADGRIKNLSKYSNPQTKPEGREDILIDGVSIFSWQFQAVNYLEGVSEELYAQILEYLTEGPTDISDRDQVTLIGGKYVRNAVLQEISEQFVKDLALTEEVVPPAKPANRGGRPKKDASSGNTESQSGESGTGSESADPPKEGAASEVAPTSEQGNVTNPSTPVGF